MKIDNIENANDRARLILLTYKPLPNDRDKEDLIRLNKYYPDNKQYERSIIDHLGKHGYLTIENASTDGYTDEFGHVLQTWIDLPHAHITTNTGVKLIGMLKRESEMKNTCKNKLFFMFQMIGISIAAIGGLINIIQLFTQ